MHRPAEKPRKSKTKSLLFVVLVITFPALACQDRGPETEANTQVGGEKTTGERIAEAEALYSQREDLSKVRLALIVLREARTADYENYDVPWKIAKFDYYLGSHASDDREREAAFQEGIEAGKIAVQLQADKADGHFWLGANYGGSAQISLLAGFAAFQDISREMEKVIEIDEGYEGGSAYMALGQLYLEAPRIFGGNNQKAIEHLEKGLRFGSNNALLRLHLAEAYHATNRDGEARQQIESILKMTPDPNYLPEYKDAVAGAKKLEKKMMDR
jgi:predicted Zn-dependent protease